MRSAVSTVIHKITVLSHSYKYFWGINSILVPFPDLIPSITLSHENDVTGSNAVLQPMIGAAQPSLKPQPQDGTALLYLSSENSTWICIAHCLHSQLPCSTSIYLFSNVLACPVILVIWHFHKNHIHLTSMSF